MATKFKVGQQVRVQTVSPQGPVQKMRLSEEGEIEYLISWVDAEGAEQSRWFSEAVLADAPDAQV
jgi:uncharacterized protein YodC (DUF2158 family)